MSDNQVSIDPVISSAMADLGIDPSALDASEELAPESESTEAEAEGVEASEENASEEKEGEGKEASAEDKSLEEEAKPEAPAEEPKLTLKEFQEIEAAKVQLEQERKAFTEQKAQMEKDFQEKYLSKVNDFDEMDAFLANLAAKDPDLFGLIQQEFAVHQKEYSANQKLMNEFKSLKEELSAYKAKASDEVTLTKLDAEMKELKSTIGKEAEDLKIKVDYKSIEDLWAKGISPKEAFWAKHGEALTTARLSKAKLNTVEKKVQAQPSVKTAGSVTKSNTPAPEPKLKNASDWVSHFAKKYGVSA